jgi:ABC-type sugar transport system substrate-binding protein
MRRPTLALLIVLAIVAAVSTQVASGSPTQQERVRIGVFLASAANTYWTAALEGVRDAARKAGNVEVTVFDG